MQKRPKIRLEWQAFDYFMEGLAVVSMIGLVAWPAYHFNDLPATIPTHFNGAGEADGFSSRGMIWGLPVIGFVTYGALVFLNRFPHIFNYPTEITKDNAERQYRLATRLLRAINAGTIGSFLYITIAMIQSSTQGVQGLGTWFLPVFLLVILGPIGVYVWMARK